jgi:hypothetical protein
LERFIGPYRNVHTGDIMASEFLARTPTAAKSAFDAGTIERLVDALAMERDCLVDDMRLFLESHVGFGGIIRFGEALDWALDYIERLDRIESALTPYRHVDPAAAFRAAVQREASAEGQEAQRIRFRHVI